ncbi:uncharacterized protein KGF55_000221 [Candida pseudojiufengensis]|uniref:uncharacterized protein n=1 Tax=Candida pseudojiufengensis TaxID=497109 RepID=UPI0022255308|nr:uncharacterized protein KGF55_000221 [Candida pseudojiufengensis]KAI5966812.1 hypothetical protein KGF55_000221 [Candida pseudojiufengensis]
MSNTKKKIRYDRLQVLGIKAVEQVIKTSFSDEQIQQCYPTIMESKTGSKDLKIGLDQLQKYLHDNTIAEFNTIYDEYGLKQKLSDLDDIVSSAQKRKQLGDINTTHIDQLSPKDLIDSTILSNKEDVLGQLELIYNQLCKDNDEYVQSLRNLTKESELLSNQIQDILDPIVSQAQILNPVPLQFDNLIKISEKHH